VRGKSRTLAWLLLAIWMTWLTAIQSRLGESPAYRLPPPDLNLVFLVSMALVVRRSDLLPLAVIAALARTAFSLDPPQAVLFLTLAVGALGVGSRRAMHLEGPLWRAFLSGFGAVVAVLWFSKVRDVRGMEVVDVDAVSALVLAVSSALAALVLGGLLLRLPGLAALRRSER
jgi:hypothetical protein